jgi:hypothetical protein
MSAPLTAAPSSRALRRHSRYGPLEDELAVPDDDRSLVPTQKLLDRLRDLSPFRRRNTESAVD